MSESYKLETKETLSNPSLSISGSENQADIFRSHLDEDDSSDAINMIEAGYAPTSLELSVDDLDVLLRLCAGKFKFHVIDQLLTMGFKLPERFQKNYEDIEASYPKVAAESKNSVVETQKNFVRPNNFFDAIFQDTPALIYALRANPSFVMERTEQGQTFLAYALHFVSVLLQQKPEHQVGYLNFMEFVLKTPSVEINALSADGTTVLSQAIRNQQWPFAQLFLKNGADPKLGITKAEIMDITETSLASLYEKLFKVVLVESDFQYTADYEGIRQQLKIIKDNILSYEAFREACLEKLQLNSASSLKSDEKSSHNLSTKTTDEIKLSTKVESKLSSAATILQIPKAITETIVAPMLDDNSLVALTLTNKNFKTQLKEPLQQREFLNYLDKLDTNQLVRMLKQADFNFKKIHLTPFDSRLLLVMLFRTEETALIDNLWNSCSEIKSAMLSLMDYIKKNIEKDEDGVLEFKSVVINKLLVLNSKYQRYFFKIFPKYVNEKDELGGTLFHYFVKLPQGSQYKYEALYLDLIQSPFFDFSAPDNEGNTALHIAAKYSNVRDGNFDHQWVSTTLFPFLLDKAVEHAKTGSFNFSISNKAGQHILHIATRTGRLIHHLPFRKQNISGLLNIPGIDINAKDAAGATALDIAINLNLFEEAHLLLDHDAALSKNALEILESKIEKFQLKKNRIRLNSESIEICDYYAALIQKLQALKNRIEKVQGKSDEQSAVSGKIKDSSSPVELIVVETKSSGTVLKESKREIIQDQTEFSLITADPTLSPSSSSSSMRTISNELKKAAEFKIFSNQSEKRNSLLNLVSDGQFWYTSILYKTLIATLQNQSVDFSERNQLGLTVFDLTLSICEYDERFRNFVFPFLVLQAAKKAQSGQFDFFSAIKGQNYSLVNDIQIMIDVAKLNHKVFSPIFYSALDYLRALDSAQPAAIINARMEKLLQLLSEFIDAEKLLAPVANESEIILPFDRIKNPFNRLVDWYKANGIKELNKMANIVIGLEKQLDQEATISSIPVITLFWQAPESSDQIDQMGVVSDTGDIELMNAETYDATSTGGFEVELVDEETYDSMSFER